jgi:hypothetical protein
MAGSDFHDLSVRLGLAYEQSPPSGLKDAFRDVPNVPRGCTVRHVLRGHLAGPGPSVLDLVVFQSTYMVPIGQVTVPVSSIIGATTAPAWPKVVVRSRSMSLLGRLLGRSRGTVLDDPEFNRRFRVDAQNEDFAIVLLSPDLQRLMLSEPKTVWRIGPGGLGLPERVRLSEGSVEAEGVDRADDALAPKSGRVCTATPGSLRPDRAEAAVERMRAFWSMVPPELLSW